MKNAPYNLSAFFIVITIVRVAVFVVTGLNLGPLGYAFAVGIAAGVYVSSYYLQFKETKGRALAGLALFLLADLWFNVFEVVRSTSTAQLVPPEANFLGLPSESLRTGMQWSAIAFGILPTLAAAILGWLQGGVSQVKSLNRPGPAARIVAAIARMLAGITIGAAVWFERKAGIASNNGDNLPYVDGQVVANRKPKRIGQLNQSDIAFIAKASREAVMAEFNVSNGTAGNWISAARAGKLPGQNRLIDS